MNGQNIAIMLIIVVAVGLNIVGMVNGNTGMGGENFCNCSGMGVKTPRPTYYVYRPGDVSNYGAKYPFRVTSDIPKNLSKKCCLGWRSGMPYERMNEAYCPRFPMCSFSQAPEDACGKCCMEPQKPDCPPPQRCPDCPAPEPCPDCPAPQPCPDCPPCPAIEVEIEPKPIEVEVDVEPPAPIEIIPEVVEPEEVEVLTSFGRPVRRAMANRYAKPYMSNKSNQIHIGKSCPSRNAYNMGIGVL